MLETALMLFTTALPVSVLSCRSVLSTPSTLSLTVYVLSVQTLGDDSFGQIEDMISFSPSLAVAVYLLDALARGIEQPYDRVFPAANESRRANIACGFFGLLAQSLQDTCSAAKRFYHRIHNQKQDQKKRTGKQGDDIRSRSIPPRHQRAELCVLNAVQAYINPGHQQDKFDWIEGH